MTADGQQRKVEATLHHRIRSNLDKIRAISTIAWYVTVQNSLPVLMRSGERCKKEERRENGIWTDDPDVRPRAIQNSSVDRFLDPSLRM